MKHWLGLVVVALSAGLFADEAHGSPVFEWSYPGPGTSRFGYFDGDHDGNHDTHRFNGSGSPFGGSSGYRRTSSIYSGISFGSPHRGFWNDSLDNVRDWGQGSYLRWNFTWHAGLYPGRRRNSWNWCDPGRGPNGHPVPDVPVPAAALLFGSGLAFVFGVGHRKKRRANASKEA